MTSLTKTHPITEIEGIGNVIAQKLSERGVTKTEDLLALPAVQILNKLIDLDGITENNLLTSFLPQARFLRLQEMTGQLAEGLMTSGYMTYRDLIIADAKTIIGQLEDQVEEGVIPKVPTVDEVREWQIEAGRRLGTGTLHLTILDQQKKQPLEGVRVRIKGYGHGDVSFPISWQTGSDGFVFIEYLASGEHDVVITCDGYKTRTINFGLVNDDHVQYVLEMISGEAKPYIVIDEFAGEAIPSIMSSDVLILDRIEKLSDLPSLPPFTIAEFEETAKTVLLISLWRKKINDEIHIPYLRISKTALPTNVTEDNIIKVSEAGTFEIIEGLTQQEYHRQLLAERPFSPRIKEGK
jgi:hypothetical protein